MNTGTKIYRWLREIDANTGQPTGNRKPNLPSDPDYIAPITDVVACPLSASTDPTVTIRWSDNNAPSNVYADRYCNSLFCSYQITIDALDANSDIITKELLVSYDQGSTWSTIVSNITGNTFSDSLSGFSSKWYKVQVTDSQPVSATSNILKVEALSIGIGQLVLVYNGVEIAPFNSSSSFTFNHSEVISFMVRNKSTNTIAYMRDINPFGGTGIACNVETLGGVLIDSIYIARPQIGDFIAINNGWLPLTLQDLPPGSYKVRVAVEFPEDPGFPPFYLYTYFWYITII